MQMVLPYSSTDMATAWKSTCFISWKRSDIVKYLSVAVLNKNKKNKLAKSPFQ